MAMDVSRVEASAQRSVAASEEALTMLDAQATSLTALADQVRSLEDQLAAGGTADPEVVAKLAAIADALDAESAKIEARRPVTPPAPAEPVVEPPPST